MRSDRRYSYDLSVKSDVSDELINIYIMRPAAGVLVRFLHNTPVTPTQVTIASTAAGLAAAALYSDGSTGMTALAGLCVTLKDLLDSADGQLARSKHMNSRAGRFLDSLGDLLVNLCVFGALGYTLVKTSGDMLYGGLACLGFLGLTLRVSYHVYYQTSFLHLQQTYTTNRITEEIRMEDLNAGRRSLFLQRVFLILYGWQDHLMVRIDDWCRKGSPTRPDERAWYADTTALRLSGFLGLGTELMILTICSLVNRLPLYLIGNVVVMNGVWLTNVWYRRKVLAGKAAGRRG